MNTKNHIQKSIVFSTIIFMIFIGASDLYATSTRHMPRSIDEIFNRLREKIEIHEDLLNTDMFSDISTMPIVSTGASRIPAMTIDRKDDFILITMELPQIESDIHFKKEERGRIRKANILYYGGNLEIIITKDTISLSYKQEASEEKSNDGYTTFS